MEKKIKKKKKTEKEFPVIFRAHWQRYTKPKIWTDLLVYLCRGSRGYEGALGDFHKHKKWPAGYDIGFSKPVYLKRGTKILIKPELPDHRFNPSQATITWYEDWHKAAFRTLPLLKGPFAKQGKIIYGQVSFFVGPILIGDIGINVTIKEHLSKKEKNTKNEDESSAYQKIFASYAREDLEIVKIMGGFHSSIGNEFIYDVAVLRSGKEWQPAILKLIKEADVFHLFWSKAAKKSPYVEKEWREALKQNKKNFIRPIFWEKPMPLPPPELEHIHFKYVKF